MTQNVINLSVEQLQAMLREARDAEKLVQQATAQRFAQMGEEMLSTLVAESALTYSKSSAWVGTSINGLPFEVDGVKFTASITVTHTAENERRKPIFAEAKKDADTAKLTGDERAKFIAARMTASEPVSLEK